MSDKSTCQYDFPDRMAHGDLEAIADFNAESFYWLKRNLVEKRKSLCPIEQVAKYMGESVEAVAEFEQYYSDPTVSQLQEYALAVMCRIKVAVIGFESPELSTYTSASLPVDASELFGAVQSTNTSEVNTHNIHREIVTI